MPYTGYEEEKRGSEPDPFNPHTAKWRVIPDLPWGEEEGVITGTIKANGDTIALFRLPNLETLKWMRERINQCPPQSSQDPE